MKLVEVLVVPGEASELLDVHLAFHLAAGVDVVLVGLDDDGAVPDGVRRFADEGRAEVERVRAGDSVRDVETRLARRAAAAHAADWVLVGRPNEFWWPRGESLTDALDAMPARYGVVQGLVREFAPPEGEGPIVEHAIRRAASPAGVPFERALQPLYRADPELTVEDVAPRDRVPLRAWYPFEVLRLPTAGSPPVSGQLVEDSRLRDAIADLRAGRPLALRAPDLVDDAAYAVDCAAVGEVDLPRLEREVAELEARVIWLEQRFWPRVLRRIRRVAR